MKYTVVEITDTNQYELYSKVEEHLISDFRAEGNPSDHFYHNLSIIQDSFKENKAILSMDPEGCFSGFVTYKCNPTHTYIDIAYVAKSCRRQGVFKSFLAKLKKVYPLSPAFLANVIDKSHHIFEKFGFTKYTTDHSSIHVKNIALPCESIPDKPTRGLVFVLNKHDYYHVRSNESSCLSSHKYFSPEIDFTNMRLLNSIFVDHDHESYVRIELNGVVLCSGKAKHIFKSDAFYNNQGFTLISKLSMQDHQVANKITNSLKKRPPSSSGDLRVAQRLRLMAPQSSVTSLEQTTSLPKLNKK